MKYAYLIPRIKKLIVFFDSHYVTRNDFLAIVNVAGARAARPFINLFLVKCPLRVAYAQEVKNIHKLTVIRQTPNPIIGILRNMQRGAGRRGFNRRVNISPIIFTRAFPVPIQPQFKKPGAYLVFMFGE